VTDLPLGIKTGLDATRFINACLKKFNRREFDDFNNMKTKNLPADEALKFYLDLVSKAN
jgi:hypothetical protein